jgi:hypothetical protein
VALEAAMKQAIATVSESDARAWFKHLSMSYTESKTALLAKASNALHQRRAGNLRDNKAAVLRLRCMPLLGAP